MMTGIGPRRHDLETFQGAGHAPRVPFPCWFRNSRADRLFVASPQIVERLHLVLAQRDGHGRRGRLPPPATSSARRAPRLSSISLLRASMCLEGALCSSCAVSSSKPSTAASSPSPHRPHPRFRRSLRRPAVGATVSSTSSDSMNSWCGSANSFCRRRIPRLRSGCRSASR